MYFKTAALKQLVIFFNSKCCSFHLDPSVFFFKSCPKAKRENLPTITNLSELLNPLTPN